MYQELLNKEYKLALIGLGYVGLPIALAFAKKIDVIGFDINQARVELMKRGIDPSNELEPEADQVVHQTIIRLRANQLQGALQAIWSLVNRANQYVDQTAPFKLAKDPAQAKRLDEVLYNLAETCRVLAVLNSSSADRWALPDAYGTGSS